MALAYGVGSGMITGSAGSSIIGLTYYSVFSSGNGGVQMFADCSISSL